jgi:hypothetical protein
MLVGEQELLRRVVLALGVEVDGFARSWPVWVVR